MEHLQPKESLAIIQKIINERKQKYEQNGVVFIAWGILITISSLVHYFTESYQVWGILMPLGFIFTAVYYFIKGKNAQNKGISLDWTDWIWFIAGLCAQYCGFVLVQSFGEIGFSFINILIFFPFIFAALATALQLKNKLWVTTSILAIIVIFASMTLDFFTWKMNILIPAVVAVLVFLIPGIQLFIDCKNRKKQ